jgi:hypothetical protein
LEREELIRLGSPIRNRLATEIASRDEFLACLEHLLATAGNASLMTKELRHTLCDHAAGNYRIFTVMAGASPGSINPQIFPLIEERILSELPGPPLL